MKIKKMLSLFVSAVMVANAAPSFSAVKRDVNDPVLREIINELNSKMPKFINRYGDTVFVEDEPVTRGSLIEALYEYDKRTKGSDTPGKITVTRQEFDSLKNRVSSIASLASEKSAAGKYSGEAADVDIVRVISDLKPNMPMLLDGSLKNSKVFLELQEKIEAGAGSASPSVAGSSDVLLKKDMDSLNVKINTLSKKLDLTSNQINRIEKSSKRNPSGGSELASDAVAKEVNYINERVAALSKKLDNMQTASGSSDVLLKDVDSLNVKVDSLSKKLDLTSNQISRIEKSSKRSPSGGSEIASDAVAKEVNYINERVAALSKKLDNMQTASGSSDVLLKDMDSLNVKVDSLSKKLDLTSNQISRIEKSSKRSPSGGSELASDAVAKEVNYINERVAALSKKLDDMQIPVNRDRDSSSSQRYSSASLSEISEMKRNLEQIQTNYVRMSKRLDELNSSAALPAVAGGSLDTTYFVTQINDIKRTVAGVPSANDVRQEISKSQSQTRSDIRKIEERLNSMHREGSFSSDGEEYSSSGGSGAAIASISLGITMIAALFVAR